MLYFPFSRSLRHPDSIHRIGKRYSSSKRGFSLIELLVVTAILSLISGLILVNNSRFGGVIRLESLAYDMALSIRQAQVYGISVARYEAGNYNAGYGVHFDFTADSYGQNSFSLFGDASLDGIEQPGEILKTTTMSGGYTLYQLCTVTTVNGVDQAEVCESAAPSKLDIVFVRPEPDGILSKNGTGCVPYPTSCFTSARVRIKSPRGDLMSIIVYNNGQISVVNS